MIIAIILMLLMLSFARYTWLLAEYLEAKSKRVPDEQSLESKIELLERCLYRTTMIEKYWDEQ